MASSLSAARLRVLVVEDEFLISIEIEGMLTDLGAEVVGFAATADEAVRIAGETRPDVVTMDVHLAGKRDGISAAIEIFERFGIRSLFVTAFGDGATRERAASAQALGWIGKPVSRGALRDALPFKSN